jgi:hypothetical protein
MAGNSLSPETTQSLLVSSTPTTVQSVTEKPLEIALESDGSEELRNVGDPERQMASECGFGETNGDNYTRLFAQSRNAISRNFRCWFSKGGKLRPFRLLRQDI